MIHLTAHTYGYSELIVQVLNGIAKFRNSGAFDSIIGFMTLAIGTYYALLMASSSTPEGWKIYFRKLLATLAFVSVLMLPKISMLVQDHVAKKPPKPVDNIPLAFALPVGVMEQWGYVLTKGFEQAFNWSGAKRTNAYSEYGMIFPARLAKDMSQARMRDPEVVANVHSFIDRCILVRGMIGYPFTLEEVKASKDIWGLVRSKTRGVITKWTKYENGVRSLQNCTQGVEYIDSKLKDQGKDFLDHLMPKYHYGKTQTAKFLEDLGSVFGGGERADAAKLITHHLMLNALDDVVNEYEGMAYGVARAKTQYEANSWISGATAKWSLTGMLALFKVIVYASFLIVLPMMILGGGGRRYGMWITTVFSLTLWPPLLAVINMVIDFSFDPAQIISYGALATAQNKYDSIGAVASSMQAMVPFLAFWVTRMGEGGIMHMASPIMAAMSGATASAGAEVASNSRSLNNTQIGSESLNNTSSNHHNTNFESVGGESSYNLPDGTMVKEVGSSGKIFSTGDGLNQSKFASPIMMRDDMQETNSLALGKEHANHKSIGATLEKGLSHQEQNIDNYVKGLAKRIDAGERVNWSALGKNAESVANAVNYELQTGQGYQNETREMASLAVEASFGGDLPFTKIGGIVIGRGELQGQASQENSLRTINSEGKHWSQNFENIVEAGSNADFGKSWGVDSNLTHDIQSTRSANMDLRQQEQVSSDRIESLQQRAEEIRSFGSSYDVSATHLVASRLEDGGMNPLTAQRLIDNPMRANAEDRYKLNQARTEVRNELMEKISSAQRVDKTADFVESGNQHNKDSQTLIDDATNSIDTANTNAARDIRQQANNDGVSKGQVEGEIGRIYRQNTDAYKQVKADIAARNYNLKMENEKKLQKAADKAKSAQPLERAESTVSYIVDKLKPPKDR